MKSIASKMVFVLIAFVSTGTVMAQGVGVVRGTVRDSISGEPMFGVSVVVSGGQGFAQTDFDGKFQLQLPPGTYTLQFQMVGMGTRQRQVTVTAGQATEIATVAMGNTPTPAGGGATYEVQGRALNNTEASLLALQKKSGAVSDGISAEAIKKSPDSSAGDVLRRVTGITLVGGKYVFVRGLGERYSVTSLNDHILPSPEPDKRVVPMDLFPASLIKNIRVIKSFMPEDTAEFSGGMVKIETKEYPDEFFVSFGLGVGANSQSTGRGFKSIPRGGNDYLGLGPNDFFGFGSDRWTEPGLADTVPEILPFQEGSGGGTGGLPPELVQLTASEFNNNWSPKGITAPVDRSVSFSIGDSRTVFDTMRFGYLYGTSYSRQWRRKDVSEFRYVFFPTLEADINNSDFARIDDIQIYQREQFQESVLWGNNLNFALNVTPEHQLFSKTFYGTQSDKTFMEGFGNVLGSSEFEFITENLDYTAREIFSQVFGGKHSVKYSENMQPHKVEWSYNYAEAGRDQPDLRTRIWTRNVGTSDPFRAQVNDGERFFSEAEDVTESIKGAYELPYEQWSGLQSKLKFGYEAIDRVKDFESTLYTYQRTSGGSDTENWPVPGEITLNPARIFGGALRFGEQGNVPDSYNAQQKLHAYFVQTDLPLTGDLRFVGGVRYENNFQKTRTFSKSNPNADPLTGCDDQAISYIRPSLIQAKICDPNNNGVGLNRDDGLFPAANLIWEVVKDMNLRLGYSETVVRPDLRELSEFFFSPFFGADQIQGNSQLERSYVHNYDFRWEWYLSGLEYIGVGYFHKTISQPIELIGRPLSPDGSRSFTYGNAEKANLDGLEVDLRKDFLERFRFSVNAFYIRSNVQVQTWIEQFAVNTRALGVDTPESFLRPSQLERPLQGQSEFVYNTRLSYFLDKEKTSSIGLYYNYFSDRISVAGSAATPDIIERGFGVLDLVFQYAPNDQLDVKASWKNITNAEVSSYQEIFGNTKLPFQSYTVGTDFSVSASYKF